MITESIILSATIGAGTSLSGSVRIGSGEVVGLMVPTWDSAAVTFQGSHDDSTFSDVHDSAGVEVSIPASTGNRAFQAPAALKGFEFIKIRSGTSGAAVNQTVAETIQVIVK